MRFITLIAFAFLCQSALTVSADARPRHRYHQAQLVEQPFSLFGSFGTANIVHVARSHIGAGAVFGRRNLWCARFMNYVLNKAGYRGTGSDAARSFANYGRRVSGPQVGAIAVMSRGKRGGHVGVVSGVDSRGNPIIVSGNHGRRVAEAVYPRGRVYAYVVP